MQNGKSNDTVGKKKEKSIELNGENWISIPQGKVKLW